MKSRLISAMGCFLVLAAARPALADDHGAYQITTDPPDTVVYVDGKKKGTSTPLSMKLPEGDHAIKLDNPCCDLVEFNVFIGADTVQKKEISLVRLQFPRRSPVSDGNIIKNPPMVSIQAGNFAMGSNEYGDEKPVHTVSLGECAMDKYEVTAWQFAKFLSKSGNQEQKYMKEDESTVAKTGEKYRARSGYENHPVNNVSWYGADTYCRWVVKRLPTEAEWEKAARGTDTRKYPWGNEEPSSKKAVYDSSIDELSAVDSYPDGVSPYGLHHMAGNVWEWTADWYDSDYYKKSPSFNPKGPSSGESRVLRGGS